MPFLTPNRDLLLSPDGFSEKISWPAIVQVASSLPHGKCSGPNEPPRPLPTSNPPKTTTAPVLQEAEATAWKEERARRAAAEKARDEPPLPFPRHAHARARARSRAHTHTVPHFVPVR